MDGAVGKSTLVRPFPPFCCLRSLVPWDVLMVCSDGGGRRARDSTLCRGTACSLDLLGRMYQGMQGCTGWSGAGLGVHNAGD